MAEKTTGSEQSTKNAASDRRTFLGQLVRPFKQIRYSLLFVGGGTSMLALFIAVTIYYVQQTILSMEIAYRLDHEVAAALTQSLTGMLTLAFVVAAILSVLSVIFGLQMSHRFYGPIVPILRHIEEMKKGNYSARVTLRKGDELLEVQDALNGLAETLEAKTPRARGQ